MKLESHDPEIIETEVDGGGTHRQNQLRVEPKGREVEAELVAELRKVGMERKALA